MKGVLVVNHFLNNDKFNTLHRHIVKTAEAFVESFDIKTNLELAYEKVDADFALFWDKDVNLARALEKSGISVFNSSRAIELCDDKAKTYIELCGAVKQPKTFISPLRYNGEAVDEFIEKAAFNLGFPIVFKECFGSFGQQVFLCRSIEDIKNHISDKPFILQEFIDKSCGRDKRLEVVGGEVVCAVRRENKNDFRSNVTNGGEMTAIIPSREEEELAVKACAVLGLDFGGVDILDGGYVCEVNSNAHIINIMNSTKIDIAPKIFEYITEKMR